MALVVGIASDEKLVDEAFQRVKADLAALAPDELVQVNLDVQAATGVILGVLPGVRALRDRLAAELPAFDLKAFDKLEDYALALRFAQGAFQTATLPPDDLELLTAEASKLRERLLADANALALHGLVDPRKLEQLKGAKGFKNVAQDLETLSQALQESWSQIQGKSPIVAEDLQAASRIGTRLTRVLGLRDQGPAVLAVATDQRLRAFTLLLRAYEETRFAVRYLRRREDDADSIAPSLYPGVSRRRPSEPEPTVPSNAPPTGSVPSPPAASSTTQMPAGTAPVATPAAGASSKNPFLT